jgi:O-antigen biosynthesis protein
MTLSRNLIRKLNKLSSGLEERIRWKMWLRSKRIETAKYSDQSPGAIADFALKPLISIILPVYNIEERFLRRCIESVLAQWYPYWELCIADDRSSEPHIKGVLEELAEREQRIRLVFRDVNGGISAASNSALALASGGFCAFLDHDDELAEDALFWVANEINKIPNVDLLYSDEDKIDTVGRRFDPAFKPDWSRDLFYSLNLLNHLTVYRTEMIRAAGGFREGFEGSQDYDVALRVLELIPDEENIRHIPRVLYHWRALPGSVALGGGEKSYAHDRARMALTEHFGRTGVTAAVEPAANNWHRVRYPDRRPRIGASLFVYGQDPLMVEESTEELRRLTRTENVEFNKVSCPPAQLAAALNETVLESAGDVLCFVAAGLAPFEGHWLDELCSFALHESIGAAGAKILGADETVNGTGLISGAGRAVEAAHYGLPRLHGGNIGRNLVICNYSAVSVICMATRRQLFEQAEGFDATNLPSALFDSDYCLKLRKLKFRIVLTPYAELIRSRQTPAQDNAPQNEVEYFRSKWHKQMETDPFYNPNFSKANGQFRIKI